MKRHVDIDIEIMSKDVLITVSEPESGYCLSERIKRANNPSALTSVGSSEFRYDIMDFAGGEVWHWICMMIDEEKE